jgi:hypothetical protein
MRRTLTLAFLELRTAWRRPSWWVLVLILLLLTWGFSSGSVTIGAGSRTAGGDRAVLNSEFNLAFGDILVFSLFYLFFVCTAFGNAVNEDDTMRVMPIVGSTGLTAREYVWGRWLGIALVFCAVFAVHLALQIAFFQLYPLAEPEKLRGPFELMNYLRPMLLFIALPSLALGAIAFAIGSVTRQTVLVFAMPVALLLASIFFIWEFSPEWLPHWGNRAFQAIDVTGFRWLNETYLKVDRGVAFYNNEPPAADALFTGARAALVALAVGGMAWAARREAARMRHPFPVAAADRAAIIADSDRAQRARTANPPREAPLADLGMRTGGVGFAAAALDAFRAELRELRRSPGLWIFVPLAILQTIGPAMFAPGPFDTPRLITPGTFAAQGYNTFVLLSIFLVLYYFTEGLARDERSRLGAIVDSTPARTGALTLGRMAACAAVIGTAIFGGLWASMAIAMVVQAVNSGILIAPSPLPLLVAACTLLLPTLFVWMCFLALAWSQFRNRYAVYAAGLGALILTGWCVQRGWMNWVFNWHLWGGLQWTDFGALQLDRGALVLNRLLWILAGLTMLHAALEWWRRRTPDAQGISTRLRGVRAWKRAARLLVFGAPAATVAIVLALMVRHGPAGSPERERERQYYVGNAATWKDVPNPEIVRIDLDLDLDPAAGTIAVKGTYGLRNTSDKPIRRIALTPNTTFDDVHFTWEGTEWDAAAAAAERKRDRRNPRVEDSAGLWVFTPEQPLAPGASVDIGFRHVARVPGGTRQNPGGAGEFILPAGTVINSFAASFLPALGYQEGVGMDPERVPEPKRPAPDDWKKVTKTAFGTGGHTDFRARVRLPAEYRANMPGVCTSDTVDGGVRTMEWASDHPVMAVNLVAGRWEVAKGKTTTIYHLPQHAHNIAAMVEALDGAREWYSKWFWPYPWKELRISEFPGLAGYAQGFPSNIVFSESIGFLAKPTTEQDAPFMVTAHESAHQWWGNILRPGDGPGGNILSEGMAHFSTARLFRQLRGDRARQAFMREIEFSYANGRQVDEELPMAETTGDRRGDTEVTYDKGGWVFWMLMEHLGDDRMDEGLRAFVGKFKDGPDYPLLQDFVESMRPFAKDPAAYQAFVDQWVFDVVVPEPKVKSAVTTPPAAEGGTWRTVVTVENAGTGTVPLELAVTNGEDRWPAATIPRTPEEIAAAAAQRPEYRDARAVRTIKAGETLEWTIESPFEPKKAVVDPDVRTLMLGRKTARADVTPAAAR